MDISISALFRCMRCGKEVPINDGVVDVDFKNTSDNLGFQVNISAHEESNDCQLSHMCIPCLKKYLLEIGLDEKQVKKVVNEYQNQVKEIEGEYVVG